MVATDDPLHLAKYNTSKRLTKCNRRHPHWVTPHTRGRQVFLDHVQHNSRRNASTELLASENMEVHDRSLRRVERNSAAER